MKIKVLVGLLLLSVLLAGCGFKSTLKKEEYSSLEPLKGAGWGQEITWVHSAVAEKAVGIPLSVVVPVLGAAHQITTSIKLRALTTKVSAVKPGVMELTVQKFVQRAPEEIPNWPKMAIAEGVDSKYLKNLQNSLVLINVTSVLDTGNTSYTCTATVKIYNQEGKLVWATKISYDSSKHGRPSYQFEDLVANDFALLKEEAEFAANAIVTQIIGCLK